MVCFMLKCPKSTDLLCLVLILILTENARLQEDFAGIDLPHFFYYPTQLWGLDSYHAHLLLRMWRAAVGHCKARHEVSGVWGEMSWEVSGPPQCWLSAEWVLRLRRPACVLILDLHIPVYQHIVCAFSYHTYKWDTDGPSSHRVDGISSALVHFSLVVIKHWANMERKGFISTKNHSLSLREIRMGAQVRTEAENNENAAL